MIGDGKINLSFGNQPSVTDQKKANLAITDIKKDNILNKAVEKQVNLSGLTQQEHLMNQARQAQGFDQQVPQEPLLTQEDLWNSFHAEAAKNEYNRLENVERSVSDSVKDTAIGAISGIGSLIGGLGSLGRVTNDALLDSSPLTGTIPELAEQAGKWLTEEAQKYKSDELQEIQKLSGLEKAVRAEDSEAKFNADIAAGRNTTVSSLARVGRDALSGAQAMVDNPATLGDALAENAANLVGSAGGGAVLARGLAKRAVAARGVTGEAAERFLTSAAGQKAIQETSIAIQPLISGAQEAGGQAMQAGQEIDKMSFDDLEKNSAEYRELIKNHTPEEAKELIRFDVVSKSAAASGLTGLVMGNLTKTFDAAPFASAGIASVAKNIVGETVEEAVQGGVGQVAQNTAIKDSADNTKDVLEGVGEAVGEGAVVGAGMVGATQAPAQVIKTSVDATKMTGNAIKSGTEKVTDAVKARTENQINEDSAITPEVIEAKQTEADNAADALVQPTEDGIVDDKKQEIVSNYRISDEEYDNNITDKVKSLIADEDGNVPRERTKFITKLALKYSNKDTAEEDKAVIAVQLIDEVESLGQMFNDQSQDYVNNLEEGNETVKHYNTLLSFMDNISKTPQVKEARDFLIQQRINEANLSDEAAATPEGAAQAKMTAAVAGIAPQNVSPEASKQVLDLVRKRIIQLPERSIKALEMSEDISKFAKLYSDEVATLPDNSGKTSRNISAEQVTNQIISLGWQEDGTSSSKKLSLIDHATTIRQLSTTGQKELAADQLADMTGFATSLVNKIKAFDLSSKDGKKHPYDVYNPVYKQYTPTEVRKDPGVQLHAGNQNSINLYKRAFAETSTAVAMQRTLALAFPELGITPMEMPLASISIARRQGILSKNLEALATFKPGAVAPVGKQNGMKDVLTDQQESARLSEPDAKVPDVPKPDLKERFGSLVQSRFTNAFIADEKSTSTIKNDPTPYKTVNNQTKNKVIKSKLMDKVPAMVTRFSERLNADIGKGKTTPEKGINYPNLRGLTFAKEENGNYQIDQQIAETIGLSAMSSVMGLTTGGKINIRDMLEKQNIDPDEVNVDGELYKFFLNTTPMNQVISRIGKTAMRSLGIKSNPRIGEDQSRGAFESMAHDALAILEEQGVIEIQSIRVNDKTLNGIKWKDDFLTTEDRKEILSNPDELNNIIDPVGEKVFYIATPPTDEQLRMSQKGTGLGLSQKQKKAIRFQSNIAFKPNIPFIQLSRALGDSTMKAIRGYVDITPEMREKMNVNDLASIEGKNLSIEMEMADTEAALVRMGQGQVDDADLAQESIYFPHEVTKVNRMQMVGPANPQANKYARSALRSTWATLDMRKPEHQEGFWRTVLQMSGAKINDKKIEYLSRDTIMASAENAIISKYGPVISELEKFYSDRPFDKSVITNFSALKGSDPVVLEALSSVARLNVASEADRKAFVHSVPLEADGVTNGPAAVLMKFATGGFTGSQLAQYERIGFFLTGKDNARSLDTKSVEGDTYSITADIAQINTQIRQRELQENFASNRDAVNRFMQIFNPKGITIDNTVDGAVGMMWNLTRDAAKNPLTKTTYGAGKMGTARGIAKDAIDKFYKAISEASMKDQGADEFAKSLGFKDKNEFNSILNTIFGESLKVGNRGGFYIAENDSIKNAFTSQDFSKLTITAQGVENFSNNLNTVYVDPLFEAVKTTMGSSFDSMQLVIKAAQVQAAVLRQLFRKFEDRYSQRESFSPAEYKQWIKEFERLGAFIETDGQSFFIGLKGEGTSTYTDKKGNRQDRRVSAATEQSEGRKYLSSSWRTQQPEFAGVSAAAYINIGTGDGLMMTEALANYVDGLENTLQIFDGMEMAADKISSVGPHMNKAAYAAWNASTIEDVLTSFENFARNFSDSLIAKENFNDSDVAAVLKEAIRDRHDKRSLETLINHILDGYSPPGKPKVLGLKDTVAQIKARREALASVATSTDQMAGAGMPYYNDGDVLTGSFDDQAAALNERARKIMQSQKDTGLRQAEANQALTAQLSSVAEDLGDGVKTIPLVQLRSLISRMSKQSQAFYRDVIRDALPEDIEVIYGPVDALQRMRDKLYPDESGTASPLTDVNGQYDRNYNVIFLIENADNRIGETILHELTHAAIADKIDAYFNDIGPGSINTELRAAVSRLTALTEDFLNLNFSNDGKRVQDAVQRLRDMREGRGLDSKVVNETIAEILTNPDLITVAKQQKTRNGFLQLLKNVISQLQKLIPGLRKAGDNYFSNAAFNAQIVSKLPLGPVDPSNSSSRYNQVLDKLNPTNSNAQTAASQIASGVSQAINNLGLGKDELIPYMENIVDDIAITVYTEFDKAGFTFNIEEAQIFKSLMTLFISDARINGPALIRAQNIYDEVMKDLSLTDFEGSFADAQAKLDAVLGTRSKLKDAKGNSLVLARFLALAVTNKEFGELLSKKAAPKAQEINRDSIDNILSSITQNALDNLTNLVVGETKGSNAHEAIKNIIGRLANFESEKQTKGEELYQNVYGYIDQKAAGLIDQGATALAQKIESWNTQIGNKVAKLPVYVAQAAVSAFSKSEGSKMRDTITKTLNVTPFLPYAVVELGAEIFGRGKANANIYDMVNRNRFESASIRQEFREQYPILIQEKFSRKLTDAEWKAMYIGLGQTDIAALSDYKVSVIAQFFTNKTSRDKEIAKLSVGLSQAQLKQSNALADYMVNGVTSRMLRRNAYSIASLKSGSNTDNIDKLISILAIDKLDKEQRKSVSDLMIKEREGIEFSIGLLSHTVNAEKTKFNDKMVDMNQWKGFIPQQDSSGINIIIADNSDHKKLVLMGYERIGAYGGESADYQGANMSYYRSVTSTKNPYTQGAAVTVQNSQNGIDIRTGRSINGRVSGTISGRYAKIVLARMQNQNNGASIGEHLLPVYAADGVTVLGFERAMRPEMLALKKPDMHFGHALGIMAGRQIEESKARKFNSELAKEVKRVYDEDSLDHDEYVDLATSTDPVHKDIWDNVIPHDMKQDLANAFEQANFFPVRKDMIPMVVGYRNAGVTDLWTGVSRLPENVRNTMKDILISVFGRKAYSYLYDAEKLWTRAISEAKMLIVVKSVIVPAFNLMSNISQLLMYGVPLRSIATLGTKKFVEITKYGENQQKGIRLQAQLRVEKSEIGKAKIRAQIEALKAVDRKLSIWPLIERGEFSTITEGLSDLDVNIKDGRFVDWIEAQVEKLPDGVRTVGRYAVVSRSTSLYKGLNRAVQYGDFLAKAILHDDMINRQKKAKAEVDGIVSEAFVNYNIPAGRSRTFMEAFGLAWFHNFKIRSLKSAHYIMQNNPVRALFNTTLVNQVSWLGSPITDNVLATALDGRLTNSFGLGMMFRAPELNPWFALTR